VVIRILPLARSAVMTSEVLSLLNRASGIENDQIFEVTRGRQHLGYGMRRLLAARQHLSRGGPDVIACQRHAERFSSYVGNKSLDLCAIHAVD
jgi:hypothetical protein